MAVSSGNMTAETRKIIHIDMDAFFASVEQRDDPSLRGKPVAVGHGAARGVVAAASYEARSYGVRSAMPSVSAIRRCPDLIFVKPRFHVYKAVSQQIHQVFARYTAMIEPLSLDEAYLDVTANLRRLPSATETAIQIRTDIYNETGLTASAGISYNKFLAKLASDHRKPNGQFVITPAMGADFIAHLPVGRFHGIGPVTAATMNRLGIHTGWDLQLQPLALLQQHFGKAGSWYHAIAHGQDERPVRQHRLRKSSGSETTFSADRHDASSIEAGLIEMADDVWAWCDREQAYGRTVTVKIKYTDFQQITRRRTLPIAVNSRELLHSVGIDLLRSTFPPARGVRLVGISISGFTTAKPPQSHHQPSLFEL